ncbi:MAG: acyltransferase [Cyanobacteria bacterium J06598_1]
MFLNSLNYFRAIAILIIVAGHAFYAVDISFNTLPERALGNLVGGGTVLFVFISGFLFHHIFYRRYQFKKFMTGKLKKVLLPYTLLSITPIALRVLGQKHFYPFFEPKSTDLLSTYLVPTFKYYITGRATTAYWYIPFVMVIFLMSPLHMAFIKLKMNRQLLITFVLTAIALFLHRPENDLLILQAVVYFTPVYFIGILCSERRELIYTQLKNKEVYLLLAAVGLAVFQASLGRVGSYQKAPFLYEGIDMMLFQKLALCLFFMVWLHRFEKVNSKLLNIIASTSFAIYFTHIFTLYTVTYVLTQLNISGSPWALFLLVTAASILLSVGLALGIKKLLPNYSRYLVGY